jgi:hypothetical protein
MAGAMRLRQHKPQRVQKCHDSRFMKASFDRVKVKPIARPIDGEGAVLPGAFPLGPFIVEESGRLSFRSPDHTAGFSFAWRNRRFSALLTEGTVSLTGALGKVPSSAEGPARREAALALLRALPRALPRGWALRLTADHRIQIKATEPMAWPAHATDLMQPLIRFLLRLAPYLDLMDEEAVQPAG